MYKSLPLAVRTLALFSISISSLAVVANGQQPAPAKAPKAAAAPTPAVADGPPVAAQPHKVYVDAQANKIFWPMDMPFWVRLSASPDPNAPSYLMQRVAPDPDIHSDITTEQYNKEGIELEIRGRQFIRWFNYITKEIVFLEFFSDGDPPVTKATCTGAPTAVVADQTYYGKGLQCSLASEDELSGVDTTFLSLADQPWKPYAAAFNLNTEGPVVLRYYAIDHVGWTEKPSALRFTVNLSSPVTIDAITGNALGDVLSTQAKFRITSSDALSGVATVSARFDKEDFKPVTDSEVSVENLPDGEHTLSFYAVDRVSNRETEHVVPFYLDRIPPTTDSQVVGDLFMAPGGTRYISARSKVQLSAQDNKSGVQKIEYSFEGTSFQQYADPFLLPTKAGVAKLSYRASDKLGNTSTVATLPYSMDIVPPQSQYKIVGPSYQVRSDIYITKETRIELSAADDASGVQHTQYEAEGEPQPHLYNTPLAYPDEGRRLVRYWSTDQVNNRELDRALILITDNTAPQIFANFSLKTLSTSADGLPVYRRLTSLFLGATDNASGVHAIYYSFDGGKEMQYSTPLVLDKAGTYNLTIRCDDNLGNQSTKNLQFVIGN